MRSSNLDTTRTGGPYRGPTCARTKVWGEVDPSGEAPDVQGESGRGGGGKNVRSDSRLGKPLGDFLGETGSIPFLSCYLRGPRRGPPWLPLRRVWRATDKADRPATARGAESLPAAECRRREGPSADTGARASVARNGAARARHRSTRYCSSLIVNPSVERA